jgi:hypothetical protein|nr:MAG TPA: hypothetical protein [Caudoviricetes sp.]
MTTDDFREKVERLGFVVAFTHDVNLADKVSKRGAEDVILLMDRIHNIRVEKEMVR